MHYFKVEPLSVAFSIHVIFQQQVIFYVIHFNSSSQVSIFKARLKNQDVLLLRDVYSKLMLAVATSWIVSLWQKFR